MPTDPNGSTARSGELGKAVIDDVLVVRLTQWTLTAVVSESAWGDSDSQGFTNRKKAKRDATGSVTGKFDTDTTPYELFEEGDIAKLALWETTTAYWVFPRALMQNFKITYDQDTKEVVEWSSDFGADGIFYKPGAAGAPAQTLPT